jgi:hypothetical protein
VRNKKCYTDGTEVFCERLLAYPEWMADYLNLERIRMDMLACYMEKYVGV